MRSRSSVLIALLLISPVVVYFLLPSDEAKIRKLFSKAANAVEEEKTGDVMAAVSFTYQDDHNMTYALIRDLLVRVFGQMDNISVEYEIKNVEIRKTAAVSEVEMRVIASRGNEAGYFIGDAARPVRVRFFLEKERTRWLVTRTEGLHVGG